MHAEHLEAAFGVGPHTISVPQDLNMPTTSTRMQFDNGIDDDIFAKIVACIRIAVPYTGMIISTREDPEVRENASCTWAFPRSAAAPAPAWAATTNRNRRMSDSEQFDVSDTRTLDEVVRWLMEMDYIPSFCTACYREGRTGDRFMTLCKSGQISELLPSECTDDIERIFDGLCFPCRQKRSATN